MAAITETYGPSTDMPLDPVGASRRMTAYYAFNSRRYCHAIAPGTPSAMMSMKSRRCQPWNLKSIA